jgi:hypothetical protein
MLRPPFFKVRYTKDDWLHPSLECSSSAWVDCKTLAFPKVRFFYIEYIARWLQLGEFLMNHRRAVSFFGGLKLDRAEDKDVAQDTGVEVVRSSCEDARTRLLPNQQPSVELRIVIEY